MFTNTADLNIFLKIHEFTLSNAIEKDNLKI